MTIFRNIDEALEVIRKARSWLFDHQPKVPYESPLLKPWTRPTPEMTPARLLKYATTVIPQRMLQLLAFGSTKTLLFADGYLIGIDHKNPYLLYTNTRCQVELLAAMHGPTKIIHDARSAGLTPESVTRVDRSLVTFLFGNRTDMYDLLERAVEDPQEIPPCAKEDLNARNILTLLEKLDREPGMKGILERYKPLCEYLHPNYLSNIVLTEPFARDGHAWIRIHDRDDFVVSRAIRDTSDTMAWTMDLAVRLMNALEPPFGSGPMIFPSGKRPA